MARDAFEELRELVLHSATVQASAVDLLKDIAARLEANPTPDEIRELSQTLRAHADELGSAVAMHGQEADEPEEGDDEPEKESNDDE